MIRVGFDVDGVLADFIGAVRERGIMINMTRDHSEEVDFLIRREMGRPGFWVDMKPTAQAKEALAMLRGNQIVFISSIPREFAELRVWWIKRHFGKYLGDYMIDWGFESVKHAEKPACALSIGLRYFIEDSPDTALAMKKAGLESYLVPGSKEAEGIEQISLTEYAKRIKRQARG